MLLETRNVHFHFSGTLRSVTWCLLPRAAQQTPFDGAQCRRKKAMSSSTYFTFSASGWSSIRLVSPYSFTELLTCDKDFVYSSFQKLAQGMLGEKKTITRNCTQYCLAWVFLPFVHVVFQLVSGGLLLVLSCLLCNCCWLTVCIIIVVLCVLLSYV